jgi:hypothetical protein
LRLVPRISVQAAADRYASGASGAGQRWQEGAQAFQGDPTALAAQNLGKAKAAYAAAIDSGRTARALAASGRSGWLGGISRSEAVSAYTGGTSGKGKDKWAKKMTPWWPVFDSLSAQIATMPSGSTQDSINRVAAWINGTKLAKQNL